MNPTYRFELNGNDAFPIYGSDLAKEFERQSGEQFFRAKLSGKLTFSGDDYSFITAQQFDYKFLLSIFISYDGGITWEQYWTGQFWKTDCEFDDDTQTVTVTPSVVDVYNNILAGIDKEYNLIDLLPEIVSVNAQKRPMIQVYVPGQSVIACFLSGMWWEQDAEPESDETKLVNTYHFALNKSLFVANVSGTMTPQLPDMFTGVFTGQKFNPQQQGGQTFTSGDYTLVYFFRVGIGGYTLSLEIRRTSTSTVLWSYTQTGGSVPDLSLPKTYSLTPVSGSGASGTVSLYLYEIPVYARYVLDVQTILGQTTYSLPDDDIVPNNRNYHYAIGYGFSDVITFSSQLTQTPTEWGIYEPGQYYQQPYSIYGTEFFPVARNAWGRISIWFSFSAMDWITEEAGRAGFTIKNAFPISSVISVLLGKIAPGIMHQPTTDYSQFLYGPNPITDISQTLLITPKSNIITSGYDQPAQKAPITLRSVLNMLRDCFRCYWYVDGDGRFRIEHILYFRNGGTYYGTPVVGIDLTTFEVARNGKKWAFAQNKFSYDKPEMASRYEFGWMDDETVLFNGYPINILSNYVDAENIEKISIGNFSADIDYILLNPSEISRDGFVLMAATISSGEYVLPFVTLGENILQNGYAAFAYLQQFYAYDMPALLYEINNVNYTAQGVKRLKRQTVNFPAIVDPDLVQEIKTELGNGTIERLSVNLSSRNAQTTLVYDTE